MHHLLGLIVYFAPTGIAIARRSRLRVAVFTWQIIGAILPSFCFGLAVGLKTDADSALDLVVVGFFATALCWAACLIAAVSSRPSSP